MDKGREEGRAEGAHDKAVETARNMLAEGISVATVIKCTDLAEEEVSELKRD